MSALYIAVLAGLIFLAPMALCALVTLFDAQTAREFFGRRHE